jgi:hypothetical protein
MADTKKESKSEFSIPQKVFDVCKTMQDIETLRGSDRSKINSLFNGQRPYSKEDESKYQIQINVNWGEGKRIMLDANRQLDNALLHPGILFNCALEEGKVDKRDGWSTIFTNLIHKPLQRGKSGKRHRFLVSARNKTVCMHGVGAILWPNDYRWMGRFVPLEDLLIPTDTYCDFSNMRYFAVNLYLSPGEFADMTVGDSVAKGWDEKMCKDILDEQKNLYTESTSSTWRDQPEAMKQIHDQNRGYYYSDKVPTIKLRRFYYQEVDELNQWYQLVVLRESIGKVSTDKFLYENKDAVFATDIDQILNVQYGDGNLIAPLKYHSVRGLGVDLFAPVETLNRLRCDFVQAVFEHMKMYFKIQDPADRDRLKQVVLQQFGFIPDGLTVVPRTDRHQIDAALVDNAMAQMRGIMQENSASFVKDVNTGQEKEMTAFETNARLNQSSVMVNGMLQNMYLQEGHYYEEIVRRFCYRESADKEVKQFRADCIKQGIPEELMVADKWRVTPERVLGGGDRTLAQQEAQWLMQNKNIYDPKSQTMILRLATSTMLNDPAKALMLVPTAPVNATEGTYAAENVFGTMMQGIQVSLRTGIDQIGYIETLLKMMGAVIQRISSTNNVGTPEELVGLVTVSQNVGQHMMILAGDEKEKQRVKQYGDAMGKLINEIKGFAQRQAQAKGHQGQQGDPKEAAKVQAIGLKAQVGAQIKQKQFEAKQRERMIEFELDQSRENMRLIAEIKRTDLTHKQQLLNDSLERTITALRGVNEGPTDGEK